MANTLTITIAGVDRTKKVYRLGAKGSLTIDMNLGSDWQAEFPCYDMLGTSLAYRPALDDNVVIAQSGTTIFHGKVVDIKDEPLGNSTNTGTLTRVTARAQNSITQQLTVNKTYASGSTLKTVVSDLVTTYLASFGITLDAGMAAGATLAAQTFDRVTVEDVLNHLQDITGWVWRLRPDDVLEFFSPGTKLTSYSLTLASKNIVGPMKWQQARTKYANRIILRAGTETQVEKTDTFTGNGVTTAFALTYTPIATRGYLTVATVFTPLGTGTNWTISGSTLTAAVAPAAATAIGITYTAQFPIVVSVEDSADIATRGAWEETFDAPDIFDKATATELATGLLRNRKNSPRVVTLTTRAGSTYPGDTVTITHTDRLISGSHLITKVTARDVKMSGVLEWELTCVAGSEYERTALDIMRNALGSGSVGGSSGGGVISGSVLPALSGNFQTDVLSNQGVNGAQIALSTFTNSQVLGAAVWLGRQNDATTWALVGNNISPSPAIGKFDFICPSFLTAAKYHLRLYCNTGVNDSVYLVPDGPGGGVLNIGGPTALRGSPNDRVTVYALNIDVSNGVTEHGRTAKMGEWTAVTFAAGNFTASGLMTWTVGSGDVLTFAWTVVGKTMTVALTLNTTTVGGTVNSQLLVAIPGGFTAAKLMDGTFKYLDNGTEGTGLCRVSASGTTIALFKTLLAPNWTLATDNTYVSMTFSFEVQ